MLFLYILDLKNVLNIKATIYPKNSDNNCFQQAVTAALNYQSIKKDFQMISNSKPFINQHNWEEIYFPVQPSKDWKNFNQIISQLHYIS